jgi:hypothetical protein
MKEREESMNRSEIKRAVFVVSCERSEKKKRRRE